MQICHANDGEQFLSDFYMDILESIRQTTWGLCMLDMLCYSSSDLKLIVLHYIFHYEKFNWDFFHSFSIPHPQTPNVNKAFM